MSYLNHTVTVLPLRTVEKKREIGSCISPIFGSDPEVILMEWAEVHILFGMQRFYAYSSDPTPHLMTILKSYEKSDHFTLIDWSPSLKYRGYYGHQVAMQNDCLFRNYNLYEYLMFHDLDEYFIPMQHDNYRAALASIYTPNISEWTLMKYEMKGLKTLPRPDPPFYLILEHFLWRDKLPNTDVGTKPIVRPEMTAGVTLHNGISLTRERKYLPSDVIRYLHYTEGIILQNDTRYEYTEETLRFGSKVRRAIGKRLLLLDPFYQAPSWTNPTTASPFSEQN